VGLKFTASLILRAARRDIELYDAVREVGDTTILYQPG
jgi:hypothetical protein